MMKKPLILEEIRKISTVLIIFKIFTSQQQEFRSVGAG